MFTPLDVWEPASRKPVEVSGVRGELVREIAVWGGGERRRQAQITCVVILLFTSRDFFFSPYRLCCCSQHPIETCSGPRSQLSFSSLQPEVWESWWLCTILANCHGDGGGGSAFPTGSEPVALSTFCSSTKLICLKETVISSDEELCHLTSASCSVTAYMKQSVAFNGWIWGRICEVKEVAMMFVFS